MDPPAPNGLRFGLQKRQAVAFRSRGTEVLYGGAAGGGKSHLLRVAAIAWANLIPGLQIGLFRRLYPDLRANHMEGPTSFPVLLGPMVESGHCRIVRDEISFHNGSRISLNHCQHETDKFRYQGAEFHVLLFDELTHFTETQYRFLRGRLRMTGVEIPDHLRPLFPRIMNGANPGGVGHMWVKKTFVNGGPMEIIRQSEDEGGMLRQFIPAKLEDNPLLMQADPSYAARLEGLGDPLLVRAMREGDWNIVAGAMFGQVWRKELHTCAPFAIPIDWKIWRGADDGYAAPAAVHWFTQNPGNKRIYVIAEIYKAGMLPPEFARRTIEVDAAVPRWNNGEVAHNTVPIKGLLDSAAFADSGQGVISRGNQINALGAKFDPVEKWPGSRIHRVQNLHRLLAIAKDDPDKMPGIQFFYNCVQAIETIPALPRDPRNIEDVDTDAEDHAFDSVTYGLQWKSTAFRTVRFGNT